MGATLEVVLRREHLRKTLTIAFVVGLVLTAINQLDVFLRGDQTTITYVKAGLNFCVPFLVSNLGLLAGKRAEREAKARGASEGERQAAVRSESSSLWAVGANGEPLLEPSADSRRAKSEVATNQ